MRKHVFTLLLFFLLLTTSISQAFAHTGGGPPFVTVNGELAGTNPYYQGTSNINVPQDVLKASFLPQEKITFTIDKTKLSLPPNVLNGAEFSWIFFYGDNFLTQMDSGNKGLSITRSFAHPGSYLVNVYVLYMGDTQLLDTIQVNVVPYRNYKVPTTKVSVNEVGKTVFYLSQPTIDPKATVKKTLWDVGDGEITEGSNGKSFKYSYDTANFISFLYNRIIDSNNLITDVGFQTQAIKGKLSFIPFTNSPKTSFTVTKTEVSYSPLSLIINIIILLTILAVFFFIFFKWKIKKVS